VNGDAPTAIKDTGTDQQNTQPSQASTVFSQVSSETDRKPAASTTSQQNAIASPADSNPQKTIISEYYPLTTIKFENIPDYCKHIPRWTVWELPRWQVGKPKPEKIIRYPNGDRWQKGEKIENHFGTFEQVKKACEMIPGYFPGFYKKTDDGILLADGDGQPENPAPKPNYQTYTEHSGYGFGYHVLCWYAKTEPTPELPDIKEVYRDDHWIIFTGDTVDERKEINDLSYEWNKYAPVKSPKGKNSGEIGGYVLPDEILQNSPSRTNEMARYIGFLRGQGLDVSTVKNMVDDANKARCKPQFTNEQLETKIYPMIAKFKPGKIITPNNDALKKKPAKAAEQPESPPEVTDPKIKAIAERVYRNGNFIKYCKTFFGKVWYGDEFVLEAILLTASGFYVINADFGMHLFTTGAPQIGKSDACKTALRFIRPYNKIITKFSPMWIYRAANAGILHSKQILFSDDTQFDPELASIWRNILTSWSEGCTRGVVGKNGNIENYAIPARISLILTAVDEIVENSDDAQDESRFLTLELRTDEQRERHIKKMTLLGTIDISERLKVVLAVWDLIQDTYVKIPTNIVPINTDAIAKDSFIDDMTTREFKRYITLLKAHALLCNRDTVDNTDVKAVKLMLTRTRSMIAADIAGMTMREKAVRNAIERLNRPCTIAEIKNELNNVFPDHAIRRALRGKTGTLESPTGGLLKKDKTLSMKNDLDTREHVFWITGNARPIPAPPAQAYPPDPTRAQKQF
jgi:hypothetical protein